MNKFNLTFRGKIIEGHDPGKVKDRLASLLAIDDPKLLQRYFSGDPVVLRHNMERREAAELYARLRRLGVHAELVKVGERGDLHAGEKPPEPAPAEPTPPQAKPEKKRRAGKAAAKKALLTEQAALLKAKEDALRKALRAREKEQAKNRKAEEARKKAEEQARKRAIEKEQAAQRRAMEEQAVQRAAVELAQKPSLKPVEARVRTRLETPSRQRNSGEADGRRKRQPGAPNLYSMTPFRNTPAIRARATESRRIKRLAFTSAALALAAAVILGAGLLGRSAPPAPAGASAIAIEPQRGPLLLTAADLLQHDRAGVGVADLTLRSMGVAELAAPMVFNASGELLAPGRLDESQPTPADSAPPLLRCVLAESRCEQFSPALAGTTISALAVHPLDGNIFIADASAGELLKVSPEGAVLARAAVELPPHPALRLDAGLLLSNRPGGTRIGVFRYEDDAFGQELAEIELLAGSGGAPGHNEIVDFLWNREHWWVLLAPANGSGAQLHRFDAQWQLVDKPEQLAGSQPVQLVNWGGRILLVDPGRIPVQRFNDAGVAEAALVSDKLADILARGERREKLIMLTWRTAIALCLLAAAAGLFLGWLHRARSMVYTSCKEQGAEPVDRLADSIDWAEIEPDRKTILGKKRGSSYAALALVIVACAGFLGVSALALAAILLALAGPAAALLLLQRGDQGHIGINGDKLLLVDHDGLYHMGSGSRIHYRGRFVMIDDVTVFTGSPLLPAFSRAWIEQHLRPLVANGVRVDRTILFVKLLQARHPLALGAVAIAATSAAAVALLSLQGIF
ncbi:MAG: hypothetical protein H6985_16900 [Pseudomonadales bacterium]|nr:hypothetical protein [Halioglobus sp.]MCP5131248.1 hypothetical protein [Pseudomonadales bacterium]